MGVLSTAVIKNLKHQPKGQKPNNLHQNYWMSYENENISNVFANAVEVVSKSVLIRPIQFFSGSHLPNFDKSSQSADSPLCISDQQDLRRKTTVWKQKQQFLAVYYQVLSGPDFKRKWQCRQKVGVSKTSNQNLNFYPRSQHNCLTVAKLWEKTRSAPLQVSLTVGCTALYIFFISAWLFLLENIYIHCVYNIS